MHRPPNRQGAMLSKWKKVSTKLFDQRRGGTEILDRSGVWRFREVILGLPEGQIVTHPEGNTELYQREAISAFAGIKNLYLKHEGENPTGSFKDRGMTVAISQAKALGCKTIACASTGNTSASLAAYAAQAGLKAVVFIPAGQVAAGKLAQAIGYGATCLSVKADFDAAMKLVQESVEKLGFYLVNSVNPFRLEGQKSIMWEMLQALGWAAPDWVVVPAGNLGNTSAFGKALKEAKAAGWIDKIPKIVSVQAAGANPFYESFKGGFKELKQMKAETIATAIRIGNPVNYSKAKRVIEETGGLVTQVSDEEILEAKGVIDAAGIGCEPASACSLAAVKKLVKQNKIGTGDRVVGILTGHILKDPDAILSARGKGGSSVIEIEPQLSKVEALFSKS